MKVLKFGAAWCAGCLVMKPLWAEIEAELPWLETEYYDYDQRQDQVAHYHVDDKLPTFIFVDKQGQELTRLHGEISKSELLRLIDEYRDK